LSLSRFWRINLTTSVKPRRGATLRRLTIAAGTFVLLALPTSASGVIEDVTPPEVVSVSVSPAAVDVSTSDMTFTVDAEITDNLAGVVHQGNSCIPSFCFTATQILFESPSGAQTASAIFEHVSGDMYRATVTIRRFAEAGLWRPQWLFVADLAGNQRFISNADLQAMGIDLEVAVSKTTTATVAPGGTVTTDVEADGATAVDPVEAAVTTPTGGTVSLQVTPTTTPAPSGYSLLGQQINITAQPGTVANPLEVTFRIDSSYLPGSGTVDIFRNGTLVSACTGAPQAVPDPCVESRTTLPDGDLEIVVLTSEASDWNFGVRSNTAPDCSTVSAGSTALWPANHKLMAVALSGGSDADGDELTLSVTGVTQDEPLNGLGDGDTGPDALTGKSPDEVQLRAERSGRGDGRVYRITFELSDGLEACSGEITVRVPKAGGKPAVDSGGAFDSFGP
jgi:hypothetical protein